MHLGTEQKVERSFRYEPPTWARQIWENPRVDGAAWNAASLPDPDSIRRDAGLDLPADADACAPVLFCIEDDLPSVDELWTGRISIAVFLFAVVWFGGQVLLTLVGWL